MRTKFGTVSIQKSQWLLVSFSISRLDVIISLILWVFRFVFSLILSECIQRSYLKCTRLTFDFSIKLWFCHFFTAFFSRCHSNVLFPSLTFICTTNTNVNNVENLLFLEIFYFHYQQKKKTETLIKKALNVLNTQHTCNAKFPHIRQYIEIWKLRWITHDCDFFSEN